jgi:hypothetical protein
MRVLGLVLAGGLAVIASLAAHAAPLGSNMEQLRTAPTPGIVQAWGGCGWGWHPVPGHWSQWRGGWVPPHCAPNHYYGGPGPYGAWRGPTTAGEVPMGASQALTEVGNITAAALNSWPGRY